MTVGITHFRAVNNERVIVQSRHKRRRGYGPEAVRLLFHIQLRPTPEIQLDLGGVGSLDPNFHSPGAVDTRILRVPKRSWRRAESRSPPVPSRFPQISRCRFRCASTSAPSKLEMLAAA